MDSRSLSKLLPAIMRSKGEATITVTGTSMNPTLSEGDLITIRPSDAYQAGDVLVYHYRDEGLLVHRLLKKDQRCYCKGDNAFRLEDVEPDQIIGKVVLVNGQPLPPWAPWKTELSYAVNRKFFRCRYDVAATRQTQIYKLYSELILRKGDKKMLYKKTDKMDFILTDETSLAVFDPANESTYFFNESGIDILNLLEEPRDLETLLTKLCEIYSATTDEIRADVEEFIATTVSKGIVEVICE